MARVNPLVLSQIFRTGQGAASPAAAFLVGRKIKEDREAQDIINTLREAQTTELGTRPVLRAAELAQRTQAREQQLEAIERQKAIMATAVDAATHLSDAQKDVTRRMIAAGNLTGATQLLTRQPSSSTDKPSAAEAEISRLMEDIGLSREEAVRVQSGLSRVETDPSGGVVRYVDDIAALRGEEGAVRELPIQAAGDATEVPEVAEEQTLYSLAEQATGPIQTVQAGVSQVSGAVGGKIDAKTIAARQRFDVAQNSVIRAFSLNPRYPVAEQQRILENINIDPRFIDSAELMRTRMQSVDQFLADEEAALEFQLSQPGIGREQKNADRKTLLAIQRFRSQLGVPDESAQSEIVIKSRRPAGGGT